MADVLIVGDGPGGLSAALFLAKNGLGVTVFGKDETAMHSALLYNYLGLPEITGSRFQEVAREQVEAQGARLLEDGITEVAKTDGGFTVTTEDGERHAARYLVLAVGPKREVARGLGLRENDEGGIDADRDGRTSVDGVYAIGWATRTQKIQAVISAGDGAAAALDILSRERGKQVHDFDVVES